MPFSYSPEYREMVLQQVREGRRASEWAGELEVCEATIHRWVTQDMIDRGGRDGTTTGEKAELRSARTRIRELEAELAATRLASELFDKDRVVRPKELYPIVAELGEAGDGLKASCQLLRVAPAGLFTWSSHRRLIGRFGERF